MPIEIIIPKTEYEVKRLGPAEREKAMLADRNMYPQDMPCCVCKFRWMQHYGTLCPENPGYLDRLTGIPVPPIMGDTEFIPDMDYYKNPDFEVV